MGDEQKEPDRFVYIFIKMIIYLFKADFGTFLVAINYDIPLLHICVLILFTVVMDKQGLHCSRFVTGDCNFSYFVFSVLFLY